MEGIVEVRGAEKIALKKGIGWEEGVGGEDEDKEVEDLVEEREEEGIGWGDVKSFVEEFKFSREEDSFWCKDKSWLEETA